MIEQVFHALASLRSGKALHPRGAVVPATVRRHGCDPATGVAWVDGPGEDRAVVRFSRGAGLPRPWPDVLGLAVRVAGPAGEPWDLLLATSGGSTLGRRVPLPRRDPRRATFSSIAAFSTPRGPLLVGARFREGRYLLGVATPRGPWRPFAELLVHDVDATDPTSTSTSDEPLTFEPVAHAVPGLGFAPWWRRVRLAAYRGSRSGRR